MVTTASNHPSAALHREIVLVQNSQHKVELNANYAFIKKSSASLANLLVCLEQVKRTCALFHEFIIASVFLFRRFTRMSLVSRTEHQEALSFVSVQVTGKMHAHCNSPHPPPRLPTVFISHNYCSVLEGEKMKVLEKKSGLLGFIPVNV